MNEDEKKVQEEQEETTETAVEETVETTEEAVEVEQEEQIHMKPRAPLAHDAHGILTRAKSNFHRSIFQRLARARETLLHHDANRIEQSRHRIDKLAATRQHLWPKELHLEPITELVESNPRETVCDPVHDAIGIGNIKQR